MIVRPHYADFFAAAARRRVRSSPVQLAQRQLSRRSLIKLVGYRVHWSTWSVDMDIGQPKHSLQRSLLNTHRLCLGVWQRRVTWSEPAVLGDQGAVVPAIAEGPEVEPS